MFQTPPDETRDAVGPRWRPATGTSTPPPPTATSARSARRSRSSGVDRAEVFVETKIWISDYGYDETLHGFDKSAGKLGVEQIDLLILHQALPSEFDRTLEAYRALETLLADGKVRAIGVSNFMVEHLTALLDEATVVPAVNQIEVHPYFQQREVQAFGAEHGILTQAWSPIGGITFYRDSGHTSTLEDPVIGEIADGARQDPGPGDAALAPAAGPLGDPEVAPSRQRIAENFDVFDFELTGEQIAAIDALDTGSAAAPSPTPSPSRPSAGDPRGLSCGACVPAVDDRVARLLRTPSQARARVSLDGPSSRSTSSTVRASAPSARRPGASSPTVVRVSGLTAIQGLRKAGRVEDGPAVGGRRRVLGATTWRAQSTTSETWAWWAVLFGGGSRRGRCRRLLGRCQGGLVRR